MASKLISEDALKMYPACAPNGVYILSTDGKLYDPNTWTSGTENAVGVALITNKCKIVIAPDMTQAYPWALPVNELAENVFTTISSDIAKSDFGGINNTLNIYEFMYEHASTSFINTSAYYCASYQFKDGRNGYFPSLGELLEIWTYFDTINKALEIIEGNPILAVYYYSSTQYSDNQAWGINFSNGDVTDFPKKPNGPGYVARPISTL